MGIGHRVADLWGFCGARQERLDLPGQPARAPEPSLADAPGQPGPYVGPFHWDNRRLRVRELKRLHGFPDDYVLEGTRRDAVLQVGKAVPPLLGEVVARAVRDQVDGARPTNLTGRPRGRATPQRAPA